mmetsp:Transcript_20078/g.47015  ORF Transcript_20078/g.47015 Transcript_20078/m.47015 type:complete len:265 (-) Transcript_20078:552-1346(-)
MAEEIIAPKRFPGATVDPKTPGRPSFLEDALRSMQVQRPPLLPLSALAVRGAGATEVSPRKVRSVEGVGSEGNDDAADASMMMGQFKKEILALRRLFQLRKAEAEAAESQMQDDAVRAAMTAAAATAAIMSETDVAVAEEESRRTASCASRPSTHCTPQFTGEPTRTAGLAGTLSSRRQSPRSQTVLTADPLTGRNRAALPLPHSSPPPSLASSWRGVPSPSATHAAIWLQQRSQMSHAVSAPALARSSPRGPTLPKMLSCPGN